MPDPPSSAVLSAAPGAGSAPAREVAANGIAGREPAADGGFDLNAAELYLNRELTWLQFNGRVLCEARDERNPLLERLKFLAITASNLDEFFMKRIGGLKQQVIAGMQELSVDGRSPARQITECYEVIRGFEAEQRAIALELFDALRARGVALESYAQLGAAEKSALREHYIANIFPLVTPLAMDPAHPFPFVSNLSLNLLVVVRASGDSEQLARVKVPIGGGIPRFLRVGRASRFVPLEDVMIHNLDLLFPGMQVQACSLFRVTRNANTERDEEEADDLLEMIESELRDRRFAPIVRLEVSPAMEENHRGMLAAELGLDEHADVFEAGPIIALRDLMELCEIADPALHDPPHHPADNPDLSGPRNVFHQIRDVGNILLLHPYESFATSVERFLRDASEDPKVRALKMTLYRTSNDSKILDYLCEAARNGKQVAVVVELKARFDEASNIQFARKLEEYGIHVTYGVVGLKTHCKVIEVVRQDFTGLRRYAHIATGNYHPGSARIYSDYGLLTSDPLIGQDLTELFNYLTSSYEPRRHYRRIMPAPAVLKQTLLELIEAETARGAEGAIQFKVNALEDADITRALYRASQAGVKVDLIVRDTCRLRPGIAGLSDNVQVTSVIGRFLEHGRIYYFRAGGTERYLIGSADLMKRNLESRVEVVVPIDDARLVKDLRTILDIQLKPLRGSWRMQSDGSYVPCAPPTEMLSCQQLLIDFANHRQPSARGKRRHKMARRAAIPDNGF